MTPRNKAKALEVLIGQAVGYQSRRQQRGAADAAVLFEALFAVQMALVCNDPRRLRMLAGQPPEGVRS